MLQKLETIKDKYEKLLTSLSDPAVISDPHQIRQVSKEKADLDPIIKKYDEYKKIVAQIEEKEPVINLRKNGINGLIIRLCSQPGFQVSKIRFTMVGMVLFSLFTDFSQKIEHLLMPFSCPHGS